jgi:hypothetical protein
VLQGLLDNTSRLGVFAAGSTSALSTTYGSPGTWRQLTLSITIHNRYMWVNGVFTNISGTTYQSGISGTILSAIYTEMPTDILMIGDPSASIFGRIHNFRLYTGNQYYAWNASNFSPFRFVSFLNIF